MDKRADAVLPQGLSTQVAKERLEKDGPNATPDNAVSPVRSALEKFWAPVPWLLEAAILLQLFLHKDLEAAVIAALLIFNAVLSYLQEGRAQATLHALKSRLALNASVLRDGKWSIVPTSQLVVDDVVKLSLGAIVPADVRLLDGDVSLDQSTLTGESLPTDASAGAATFSGALVTRGEATAVVVATGARTKFGKTAELVRTAHSVSSQQHAVLRIVRNLAVFNAAVILAMGVYAVAHSMRFAEVLSLLLTALLAAIPVALPATFTLAAAIGAENLAKVGVLPTRLSSIDEAATIQVLCSDKTGTLTLNSLTVSHIVDDTGFDDAHILAWAALASSDAGADPVDKAIRAAAGASTDQIPARSSFVPFDPATKIARATAQDAAGHLVTVIKGAYAVVADRSSAPPALTAAVVELERGGFRVLGVAVGPSESLKLIGAIALSDPPRPDSRLLISQLADLGVRTVMVTGDAANTAAFIAKEVGLDGPICPPGPLPDAIHPSEFAVFAGVLPEDKFHLVQAFQRGNHTVGMCGDGANDAPALRQAQMKIAVSTATDVAKSAAGIVLTEPGLHGVVAAVNEGRIAFQRILTYTLNSIIKKIAQVLVLAVGLLITGEAVLTPILMVLLMVTGDFLSMSLTTDHVTPSHEPNQWRIGRITTAGVTFGAFFLGFCTALLEVGIHRYHLDIAELRTLSVVAIVYGAQAMIYAIRDRHRFWGPRPTLWLAASSVLDVAIITVLAATGTFMAPLSANVLGFELCSATVFALLLAGLKIPIFRSLHLASPEVAARTARGPEFRKTPEATS
jgi:H+-transporting ATPase